MIVSFTGHRPPKLIGGYATILPFDYTIEKSSDGSTIYVPCEHLGTRPNVSYQWVCDQIHKALEELKPEKAISGMAQGVDQWAAEICIERNIPFVAAVPFEGHEKKWPKKTQDHYNDLLSQAAEVHIICNGKYRREMYQIRDEWMVDHCDKLIAVFDGSKSGTKNTIDYAKKIGRSIYMIDAKQRPIERCANMVFTSK